MAFFQIKETESSVANQNNSVLYSFLVQGTEKGDSSEWLNLGLGRNSEFSDDVSLSPPPRLRCNKVFPCNFCMRKFYVPQALGGHQNAHRDERRAVKKLKRKANTDMLAKPKVQSLGVQPRAFVHKPSIDLGSADARINNLTTGLRMPSPQRLPQQPIKPKWPAVFCITSEQPNQDPELQNVDLTLRL